ncbi:hypothetical protein COLO4_33697 [Corchorus olitorius]|uniref:Peptidase C1A, papain n=1 Tax=Corchorus olitorius TaxID=93759 RepID=A0A1R3GS41_9ROSI|nr:hypothetical protein COLO4_33697 [Corchorus olitorius]
MAFKNQYEFICLALIIFMVGALACEATSRTLQDAAMYERHEQWMAQYGRVYKGNNEREQRFNIFKENVARIDSFNNANDKTYKLGVNQFADLTNEEFTASRNGFKGHMYSNSNNVVTNFKYENVTALPSRVTWRKKGAVTPVKDQGQCAMEGITKLTTGKLISLSEQELVDCDTKGEDQGCEGGTMEDAFKFIKQNKGLTTESNYPYKGINGTCNPHKEADHAASINGYEQVPANSESALQKAVAHQPVSVAIDSGAFEFRFYSRGVFTGDCGTNLDHGVTVVGYGVDHHGTKFWLVKNSWGGEWGEHGYIRMQRDVDAEEGLCGIAMGASYPTA